MQYTYPRLARMWGHLERIAGGGQAMGIGTRGPGETQLETDRRLVRKRISDLKAEIDNDPGAQEPRMVEQRNLEHFTVCIVGYTNAGKSTLFNTLTAAGTYADDKLFATLDTKTRAWRLERGTEVLLSDTVGFVRDLPHNLVASFKATLEEAVHADLLLHVLDVGHPHAEQQFNDRARSAGRNRRQGQAGNPAAEQDRHRGRREPPSRSGERCIPMPFPISAQHGAGFRSARRRRLSKVRGQQVDVTLEADITNGRLMAFIESHTRIERPPIQRWPRHCAKQSWGNARWRICRGTIRWK